MSVDARVMQQNDWTGAHLRPAILWGVFVGLVPVTTPLPSGG